MSIAHKPRFTIDEPAAEVGHHGPSQAVYVFELPVRLAHWGIFLAVSVLSVSGYCIAVAQPLPFPWFTADMQTTRFVHVIAGWALVALVAMRVIWMFTGNEFASWREWVPPSRARIREVLELRRFYMFGRRSYPEHTGVKNVMAGLSYTFIYGLFAFMALSGIALEGSGLPGDWHTWVSWPVAWMGAPWLRFLHHMAMWVIWAFVCVHVSLATLVDETTHGDIFSVIISGWKPTPAHAVKGKTQGQAKEK
ncbi:MAG TPA: cytochrome b/b6 domain-containing protein [Planctomycetota bacterium]|nr:cytochrome b/b6 domain-containing protein [Planctomycetota bacterium]